MRVGIVVSVIVIAVAMPIQLFSGQSAGAVNYDAEIQALRNKISGYRDEANALRKKADTLQNAISRISSEKAQIQAEVDLKQAEYNKLVKEIKETEDRIAENRRVSGELIVQSSLSNDVPLIVRLASSNNLADYIDGEASRISVRDTIVQKTEENEKLKIELKDKQAEVKKVLDEQKAYRDSLQAKENEQAQLLRETKGNESAYKKMISKSNDEIRALQEEQARLNTQNLGGSIPAPSGGSGGYPFVGGWQGGVYGFSPLVDDWGFYYQQCTSYVAWRIAKEKGGMAPWGRMYQPGHAKYWPEFARKAGISTGYKPRAGAAAVTSPGEYGHIMYVESVSADGQTIYVSDYNLGFDGQFRENYPRPASGVEYIYF